jgi:hypothetical protein
MSHVPVLMSAPPAWAAASLPDLPRPDRPSPASEVLASPQAARSGHRRDCSSLAVNGDASSGDGSASCITSRSAAPGRPPPAQRPVPDELEPARSFGRGKLLSWSWVRRLLVSQTSSCLLGALRHPPISLGRVSRRVLVISARSNRRVTNVDRNAFGLGTGAALGRLSARLPRPVRLQHPHDGLRRATELGELDSSPYSPQLIELCCADGLAASDQHGAAGLEGHGGPRAPALQQDADGPQSCRPVSMRARNGTDPAARQGLFYNLSYRTFDPALFWRYATDVAYRVVVSGHREVRIPSPPCSSPRPATPRL